MPSSSKKQHNFMQAIAHSPSFAKKVGVSQSVGKDFSAADKGKTFNKGGIMKESKGMMKKEVSFMQKKGAPASMIKHEKAEEGMNKGGMPMKDGKPAFMKKFAKGGVTGKRGYVANGKRENSTMGDSVAGENPKIQKRGLTEGRVIKMASGGSVSSASRRADGIAQRGKTRC